jgi:hypothetical protein
MPGYIVAVLQWFQHPKPESPHHATYKNQPINYGAKVQFFAPADNSAPLTDTQKNHTRTGSGMSALLCTSSRPHATSGTQYTSIRSIKWHWSHSGRHGTTTGLLRHTPGAEVRYHSSDMVLHVSSDASYLSEPEARSRTGGHFYLGQKYGQHVSLASWSMLCPPQRKQKSGPSSTMPKRHHHCKLCWKKWGIHNHPPPSRQTLQQHTGY